MSENPGSIIASSSPGDINGSAGAPPNVGNIMQNMFSQMVSPEQMPDTSKGQGVPARSPNQQVQTPSQQPLPQESLKPVVLSEPRKESVQIKDADLNLFAEEPAETVQEAPVDEEPDMSDIPDEPKRENWKKAREALKTERKTIKTLSRDYENTKKELERYQKGEVVPEIITAKDTKIAQLEKYETIVNGKLSDEYQNLVSKPITEKSSALRKLATDYNVPENVRENLIKKIVESENDRERNSLITKYFPDAIGATKVESIVKELHELGSLALGMENKPKETMQTLQTQYQAKKALEAETLASEFEVVSKNSWSKAIEKTSSEGLFSNLILDPTNAEANVVAEKNQHRAGIQYGALVKKLHENGLRTLPEDLATGLARAVQLSIGGVGLAKKLAQAEARIAELEGTSGMIATYMRPGVNSNGGGRASYTPSNDRGPANPKAAGAAAMAVFKTK